MGWVACQWNEMLSAFLIFTKSEEYYDESMDTFVWILQIVNLQTGLVGGWTNPSEKYELKWVHLPQIGVENKTYLSCHHPAVFQTESVIKSWTSLTLAFFDPARSTKWPPVAEQLLVKAGNWWRWGRWSTWGNWWCVDIWVFPKISGTPKWMVKIMENPIKMDELGVPLFSETAISVSLFSQMLHGICFLCWKRSVSANYLSILLCKPSCSKHFNILNWLRLDLPLFLVLKNELFRRFFLGGDPRFIDSRPFQAASHDWILIHSATGVWKKESLKKISRKNDAIRIYKKSHEFLH